MRFKATIPVSLGLFVLGFYEWLAFRCQGYDWSVTEIFGDILTSSAGDHWKFPFFSYFYNGGVYLAHDPQAFVTSPLFNLFVYFSGTSAGARWLGVAYGVLGFYFTYFWLRTRFSEILAGFGALTLAFSLGMFWRLVAGHMHFLLEMFLPFFLLAIFRIDTARSVRARVAWTFGLALTGAWMIYEPGFHALFYFILPALLIELGLRFSFQFRDTLKLLIPLVSAAVLSILMILPKILAWKSLRMTRAPDATDGTLALKDVIYALFVTARATVMGFHVPNSNPERWHFNFEVSTALMPIASVAAVIGIAWGVRNKLYRERNFILAAGCLIFSILAASNQFFWELIQTATSGGIRVPSRFLGLGAFGLMIFSVYGLEGISSHFPRIRLQVVVLATSLVLLFAGNWLYRAQKSETLLAQPLPRSSEANRVPRFLLEKYCPVGSGCLNTYQVGYSDDPYIRYLSANRMTEGNLAFAVPRRVVVFPTSLTIYSLKPGEAVDIPLRFAFFGHEVSTIPPGLSPRIESVDGHLRIHGDLTRAIESIAISPTPPYPGWSLWIAEITGFLSLFTLGLLALLPAAKHSETATHPFGNASGRRG